MIVTRRAAITGLFKTLAAHSPVSNALGQLARGSDVPIPLSKLPYGAITTLPMPSADYEGKLLVDLPKKPNVHPKIKASGAHQRYDWALLFANFTCWIDLQTGDAILKTPFGSPASCDLPLPTHYLGIPMKKVGYEAMLDDKEWASVFEVKEAPVMKDRIFTGKFYVLDDGTVVAVSGEEKNITKKDGKFTDVRMKMVEFHRGPQNADVLPPMPKKTAAVALSYP